MIVTENTAPAAPVAAVAAVEPFEPMSHFGEAAAAPAAAGQGPTPREAMRAFVEAAAKASEEFTIPSMQRLLVEESIVYALREKAAAHLSACSEWDGAHPTEIPSEAERAEGRAKLKEELVSAANGVAVTEAFSGLFGEAGLAEFSTLIESSLAELLG